MKSRIASLLAYKDLGAAGVEVIPLDISELVSQLVIYFDYTVNTVSVMTEHPLACLSKIELVDGSNVLMSMSGKEAVALSYYSNGKYPYETISLTASGLCAVTIPINFGRWLWDKEFAFNPALYKNPQLRITWDEDVANSGVTQNHCDVSAYVFSDSSVNPLGFLCAKEISSQPMAASANLYVDVDTSRIIRQILGVYESTDHAPGTLINTIKLLADGGKFSYLDVAKRVLRSNYTSQYNLITNAITLDAAVTAKTIYAAVSELVNIAIDYSDDAFITAQSKFAVPTVTGAVIALSASVDIEGLTAIISGLAPHNAYPVSLGDLWEPSQWVNAPEHRSLQFICETTSSADSGDTLKVVIEQLHMYGGV